jgi:hypothetical protein
MDGALNIDIGFYTYLEKPDLSDVKNLDAYIEYTDSVSYKFIEPDRSLLYTFKAKITDVLDSDTYKGTFIYRIRIKGNKNLKTSGY